MQFKKSWLQPGKPIVSDKRSYLVQVPDTKNFNLSFSTRKAATEYKQSLARSSRKLQAKIIIQEFTGGWQLPEKEAK